MFRFSEPEAGVHLQRSSRFQLTRMSPMFLSVAWIDVDRVKAEVLLVFTNAEYRSVMKPLTKVKSAQKRNRKVYLMQNVVNRYSAGEVKLIRDFFQEGSVRD